MPPMHTFSPDLLLRIAAQHGTPCYVYDAGTIRERLAALRAFDVVRLWHKA
jgi:diaminopimelate decarboxylase